MLNRFAGLCEMYPSSSQAKGGYVSEEKEGIENFIETLLAEEIERVVGEIKGRLFDWIEINEFKISPKQQETFNKIFEKYLSTPKATKKGDKE